MTRLCAEAMDFSVELGKFGFYYDTDGSARNYWPLLNDAQAMALVKKMSLDLYKEDSGWFVGPPTEDFGVVYGDLNRAIVECVARMQKSKE
jgi:hypothetical protein